MERVGIHFVTYHQEEADAQVGIGVLDQITLLYSLWSPR